MALTTKLELMDVNAVRGGIVSLGIEMTVWADGDPTTAPELFKSSKTFESKTSIPGVTLSELLARMEKNAILKFQEIIDKYKYEQQIKNKPAVQASISNIEGNLVG